MTSLTVRNVEKEIVLALKQAAAQHNRSVEAEHRAILREALKRPQPRSFVEVLTNMPNTGTDEDFAYR